MAEENPFKKNKKIADEKPAVTDDPDGLGLVDVCPFLTAPSLSFIPSSVEQKMKGAPPMVPVLPLGLSPCIQASCKFWNERRENCSLLLAADALVRLSERKMAAKPVEEGKP